jgi:hypothetical protein
MENLAHWVIVAGGVIIILVLASGFAVFFRETKRQWASFCFPNEGDVKELPALKEAYGDSLEKRNEFWFGFGQIVIVPA